MQSAGARRSRASSATRAAASCWRAAPKAATSPACGNSPAASANPASRPKRRSPANCTRNSASTSACGAPLIAVPQHYPHKRLRLDVRHVATLARHGEGARRAGAGLGAAAHAQRVRDAAGRHPGRRRAAAAGSLPGHARAGRGRMRRGSSRSKQRSTPASAACSCARRIVRAARWTCAGRSARSTRCRRAWRRVLVNGDIALAQAIGVGVHLRSAQLARAATRGRCRRNSASARPATTLDDLRRAEAIGCDFAVLGPVRATRDASRAQAARLGRLRRAARGSVAADLRDRRPGASRTSRCARAWRAGHRRDPRPVGRRRSLQRFRQRLQPGAR